VILVNESGGYERQGTVLRQRADGTVTYIEEFNATAEMPAELRRFPFDRQRLELIFEVLGFGPDEVRLQPDPATTGSEAHGVDIAQWRLDSVESGSRTQDMVLNEDRKAVATSVVIRMDVARRPGFLLRVVVIPLALLVALSWSVFWMDRESLGHRMDISFIGVLTVVAYQIMLSNVLPQISYLTLMSAFIYISFLTMCAAVAINLSVGYFERTGRAAVGYRLDRRCRWLFPTAYLAAIGIATLYFFVRY
jgi:hypothetical protein